MVKGKIQQKVPAAKKGTTALTARQSSSGVSSPRVTLLQVPDNSGSRKTKKDACVAKCCGCKVNITEDTKEIQCDRCQAEQWKCIDCLNMSEDFYDQLLSEATGSLRWFCDSCDKVVMEVSVKADIDSCDKIDKLVSLVEKLVEKIVDVEGKLQDKCDINMVLQLDSRIRCIEDRLQNSELRIEKRLAAVDDSVDRQLNEKVKLMESAGCSLDSGKVVERTIKEEVTKKIEEDNEIEKRRCNLIVYKIPEKSSDDLGTRKASDKSFVLDLLDSVFQIRAEEEDIVKFFRLGRLSEDINTVRPLLIGFKTCEMKEKIMENLRYLKQADVRFKDICVAHDLTPKQRDEVKKLIEAAKKDHKENDQEKVENFRFLVVGQGTRRKVIKLRKQN
jgi:hypothetical protein